MKQPLIGLTPQVDDQEVLRMSPGYLEGISQAGGVPVILPLNHDKETLERLVNICDGFLFTGGPDVAPALYGQKVLPACGQIRPHRDSMELALLDLALAADKAVLGICRGIQVINVGLGGTLYQDLPTQLPSGVCHRMEPPYGRPIHRAAVLAASPLQRLLGCDELGVNSHHHQALLDLAPGLSAMAWAEDGVVEAAYMPEKKFVWAVQWHPELFPATDENRRKIFAAFVAAAR